MHAVCYKCGEEKKFPLTMCNHCQAIPESSKDRIASMSLSAECLKEKNLIKASNYIKLKKRLPQFHETVTTKATQLAKQNSEADSSSSMSFELSESFFDFKPDPSKSAKNETVTVHSIGKPRGIDRIHSGPVSREGTYQMLTWEIGRDISAEEVQMHRDAFGCIYVWYRWMENKWTWKCVTKADSRTCERADDFTLLGNSRPRTG